MNITINFERAFVIHKDANTCRSANRKNRRGSHTKANHILLIKQNEKTNTYARPGLILLYLSIRASKSTALDPFTLSNSLSTFVRSKTTNTVYIINKRKLDANFQLYLAGVHGSVPFAIHKHSQ